MNIVMITTNDPAGTAIGFTNAINRYTQHNCRLITTETRYNFLFAKDLHVPHLGPEGFEEIDRLLSGADILHFHLLTDESIQLGPLQVKDYINGKKILHHHHGHPHFRAHPQLYREKYRRLNRKALVSTPDLLRLLPEAQWQPNLVPIQDALYRPGPGPGNGSVLVGQAPTRKDLKNTDDLIRVMDRLQRRLSHLNPRLDIIENCLHQECLKRKSRCQVIFDHMQGYYGVSSLESLSQGKPVVAGLDDWNRGWISDFSGAERLPWVIARNPQQLESRLAELINEPELRSCLGVEGRRFMEQHWSERRVLRALLDFYED
jgi:hypothetical protein